MTGFVARGTILERDINSVSIAANGATPAIPLDEATLLPGRFIVAGLVMRRRILR